MREEAWLIRWVYRDALLSVSTDSIQARMLSSINQKKEKEKKKDVPNKKKVRHPSQSLTPADNIRVFVDGQIDMRIRSVICPITGMV